MKPTGRFRLRFVLAQAPSSGAIWSGIPVVGPAVDEALDVVSSVFDRVPGADWIKQAVNNGATFLGDMAKSPTGQFILAAITNTYFFPGIANLAIPGSISGMQVIGPQVASLVWAIPGMAKGDSFTKAYIEELTTRVIKLVQYFVAIASDKAADYLKGISADWLGSVDRMVQDAGLQQAVAEINRFVGSQGFRSMIESIEKDPDFQNAVIRAKKIGIGNIPLRQALRMNSLTPHELAAKYKVRADAAAAALNAAFHEKIFDLQGEFLLPSSEPTPLYYELTLKPPLPPVRALGKIGRSPPPADATPLLNAADTLEKQAATLAATNPGAAAALLAHAAALRAQIETIAQPNAAAVVSSLLDRSIDAALALGAAGGLYLVGREAYRRYRHPSRRGYR
jgi:hypothetical protein